MIIERGGQVRKILLMTIVDVILWPFSYNKLNFSEVMPDSLKSEKTYSDQRTMNSVTHVNLTSLFQTPWLHHHTLRHCPGKLLKQSFQNGKSLASFRSREKF